MLIICQRGKLKPTCTMLNNDDWKIKAFFRPNWFFSSSRSQPLKISSSANPTPKIKSKLFIKISIDISPSQITSLKRIIGIKIADNKIDQCSQEAGIDFTQEEIDNELLAIGAQEEEDGNPVLTDVNGFNMSVQPVPKTEVGSIVKRQAVAKDSKGIIILKGEPSFSASDQILIDELAFYITSNNLKA